ncbi:ABC transporter permease subunit [Neorhizobium sp. NCHU2750]|uniref:ABC transporter permease n=1 Tax=Neorhizobium sp. NCHU2750 TaxID=1825976 RepID=UPI000E71FC27
MTNMLGILLLLVLWQIAGMGFGEALLATPLQVAPAIIGLLTEPDFWPAIGFTLWQMFIGYVLAMVVGVPLGIAMGRSRMVYSVVKPWASMFIVVSAAAIVPLFIIILGRGVTFLVSIVFVVTLWYVVISMTEAARNVSPKLVNVALSFAASPLQRFRYVLLPALHPFILIAARVGLVHSLRAMVTAEMFISVGFGGMLNDAGLDISTANLFGLIVILMAISMCATLILRAVADRSAPWYASRLGE